MKKKILLTRPRASSERWAELLTPHGFDCAIEPLLVLTPTRAPRPIGQFQAVMLTSANALDALTDCREAVADLLPLPCFCVGMATGAAARGFGFTDIRCGTSDAGALAQEIVAALPDKNLPILHIAGDIVDGKAQDVLAKSGFALALWPVYEASAVEDFTLEIRTQFAAGAIAAVPVFSPRTARVLVSIVEKNRLVPACHGMVAIGLSQAVADVLQTLPWRRLRVAKTPTEEEVLACLKSETSMTDTQTPLAPPALPAPAPHRRKKSCFLWGVLGVVLLAGAGSFALLQSPFVRGVIVKNENTQSAPDFAALQRRVQILETRLDTQAETAAAQPAVSSSAAPQANTSADIAALTGDVKNLQAQIAQTQSQAQKYVASAFAFWELRETANAGHPFASQLTTLRAASDDAAIAQQAVRLEPYAASGAPTLAQLHDDLVAEEPAIATPATGTTGATFWDRVKAILQNLVSVRPLHNPEFSTLESALDNGDAQAALDACKNLPGDAQQHLAAWQQKLQARAVLDDVLRSLTAHFTAPAQGTAP